MTIILRLQGLDMKAGTEDIRNFFKGLYIPEGGVYIVGGSLSEAFIAFTTERDARLVMQRNGNVLKGSTVTLRISSMAELEHKLKFQMEKRRLEKDQSKKITSPPTQLGAKRPQPSPHANRPSLKTRDHNAANPPSSTSERNDPRTAKLQQPLHANTLSLHPSAVHSLDPNTAFILGICTVLQGLQSSNQSQNDEAGHRVDHPMADCTSVVSDVVRTPELTPNSRPGYARLFGLPPSATKEDICHFFRGLAVQEVILNVKLGLRHGCLVKFGSTQDSCDALLFNQQLLGPSCVEVRGATEKMWTSVLQQCENPFDDAKREKLHQNPLGETLNPKQKSTLSLKRKRSVQQLPYQSIRKPRPDVNSASTLSPTEEHIIMARNLPRVMTKSEIKELFGCPNIAHKHVLHLLDKEGNRTDTAFLSFNRIEDYDYAINLTGCHVGSDTIDVSSITKEKMRDMMAKSHFRHPKLDPRKKPNQKRKSYLVETPKMNSNTAARTCLFVRNMPADVETSQIKRLFSKYKLNMENINLLHDDDGKGIGEAVVQFRSQKLAAMAHGLNGRNFLGTQVLLTRINVKQMEDILAQTVSKLEQ
ncbi:putative RNA-binding protein 12-like [Scophthalmus maximus]|uniref:Putative RNA-binding protein 12-like n=1 Tax=Scophthalmus maximus TaxID=52904 RepID=A0A2U9AYF9_SCOMX|nr:RNA binding motif protein 12Ba [Scophthalmus maximus]XP_035492681.2 RNA binding motif protein 12Ba [Scophthalmus maximus]AWO96637.1 putative RNA-binding protein 12-like [Scophthalmus maximus]